VTVVARPPTTPDAASLLAAWEAGTDVAPVARGAAVLDVLAPGISSAMDIPLPRLAGLAARCHAQVFGADVEGVLECGACGVLLDVPVRLCDLVPSAVPPHDRDGAPHTIAGITVRSPTTRDLAAVSREFGSDGRGALLARCITAGGRPVDIAALRPDDVDEIDELLESIAGDALPMIRTSCPGCAADVSSTVDAAGILWERVDELAPHLLADVARLAAAFGWRESDVLALSPVRRAAYLQLASS
jgi:hypothetical protein